MVFLLCVFSKVNIATEKKSAQWWIADDSLEHWRVQCQSYVMNSLQSCGNQRSYRIGIYSLSELLYINQNLVYILAMSNKST